MFTPICIFHSGFGPTLATLKSDRTHLHHAYIGGIEPPQVIQSFIPTIIRYEVYSNVS